MLIPPALAYLRVASRGRKGLRLWVPLFLAWPLLAFLEVLLVTLGPLVAVLLLRPRRAWWIVRLVARTAAIFAALRGFEITVSRGSRDIGVGLW